MLAKPARRATVVPEGLGADDGALARREHQGALLRLRVPLGVALTDLREVELRACHIARIPAPHAVRRRLAGKTRVRKSVAARRTCVLERLVRGEPAFLRRRDLFLDIDGKAEEGPGSIGVSLSAFRYADQCENKKG